MRFSHALLALLLLAAAVQAGDQEGQACNKCRKGKEPRKTSKFPEGITQCNQTVPSTGRPFYDGETDNPNCAAVSDDGDGIVDDCHGDPWRVGCAKKENQKGTSKYNSSARKGNLTPNIWTIALIVIVVVVILLLFWLATSCARRNMGQTMIMYNQNVNLDESTTSPSGKKFS